MKLKRLQLSLGSLFLATLTFGLGLVGGMRFNLDRAEDRREIGKLEKQIEALRTQGKANDVLNQILMERHITQKQDLADLKKSHAEELRRLKDERGE